VAAAAAANGNGGVAALHARTGGGAGVASEPMMNVERPAVGPDLISLPPHEVQFDSVNEGLT